MKNRTLPYGYAYENGIIIISPTESTVVTDIFRQYLIGLSLMKIANALNEKKVEYMPGIVSWNKARLMRLIEDKRYLGNDTYPTIISEETHNQASQIKAQKNTQKDTDRKADIFIIDTPVLCPCCGTQMYRRHDSRCKTPDRWTCKNKECNKLITIADEELLQAITAALNGIIRNPDRICTDTQKAENNPEISQLNAEINRTLDTFNFNKDTLRQKMLKCVSQKYTNIDNAAYQAKRLKAYFEQATPMTVFSADFYNRTVKSIVLGTDKSISLTLINGQTIGKEETV